MNMNMNKKYLISPLLVICLAIAAVLLVDYINERKEEEKKREYAAMIERNFKNVPIIKDDLNAERAEAIAKRLLLEQQNPVYKEALKLFAEERYLEAAEACRPYKNSGNSMILYLMGRSLAFYGAYIAGERVYEDQVIDLYLKACGLDNPYAMSYLSRRSGTETCYHPEKGVTGIEHPYSATTWHERFMKYWFLRKEADDPDALYCLGSADDIDERQANIIRSAWLGHEAALLIVMEGGKFRKWGGVRPEIPGWKDEVLKKLKALADAGNPLAQYYYGYHVKDYSYVEAAAENGLTKASRWLSRHFKPGETKDEAVLRLYYALQRDLSMKNSFSYEEYNRDYWYMLPDGTKSQLTREEYQEQLAKVQEWHKAHPYRYRYVHPMDILE